MGKKNTISEAQYIAYLSMQSEHLSPKVDAPAAKQNADAAHAEDVAFFRRMTAGVQPLRHEKRAPGPSSFAKKPVLEGLKAHKASHASRGSSNFFEPSTSPAFIVSDEAQPYLPTDEKGAPYFCRAGTGGRALQKLRKSTSVVEASLDLHGLCTETARVAFEAFFKRASEQGMHCVKVIHGKGLGSVNQTPVLKLRVRTWLTQLPIVSAFHEAPPKEGGAGAVLVLLRRRLG